MTVIKQAVLLLSSLLVAQSTALNTGAGIHLTKIRNVQRPGSYVRMVHTPSSIRLRPVILTREDGKNGKLGSLLDKRGVPWEELPCIAFERLPGCAEAEHALKHEQFEWCVITSPESAEVFIDTWKASGSPPVRVACIGEGTSKVLIESGLAPQFIPSLATAKALAAELPVETKLQVAYAALISFVLHSC